MELTENILWLLKQAFYFSLTTVNDAISIPRGQHAPNRCVLRQLSTKPGLSGADLARRLLITPQGVQLALTALESRGLVERKPDPQHKRILLAVPDRAGAQCRGQGCQRCGGRSREGCSAYSVPKSRRSCVNWLGRVVEKGTGHELTERNISST